MRNIHPSLYFEELLWKDGCKWVGGIDEAGRGAVTSNQQYGRF